MSELYSYISGPENSGLAVIPQHLIKYLHWTASIQAGSLHFQPVSIIFVTL